MPRTMRDEVPYVLGLVRVVEDQQPSCVWLSTPQRVQHRFRGIFNPRSRRGGQPETRCQRRQRGSDQRGLVGRNPPDNIVGRPISVGVLDGNLRFAYAAETMQGVRQDDGDLGEAGTQLYQKVFASGEVHVALRHLPPHLGKTPRSRCGACRRRTRHTPALRPRHPRRVVSYGIILAMPGMLPAVHCTSSGEDVIVDGSCWRRTDAR